MPVDISLLKPYHSAVEDNRRWADFDVRPGDIFVCTPAKCGTTWTQTILASLLWPAGDQPQPVTQLSPWMEAQFMPAPEMHAMLRAQTHRRFIKTHTPADGIPWYDDARYIFVARDGRDAFMSMCNHQERMSAEIKAALNTRAQDEGVAPFPDWDGNVHAFFRHWLAGVGHIDHVGTFWERRHQANLLLVHYNDLKADLEGEMARIAAFLDIEVPEDLWQQTVQRCTFEAMRNDEQRMGAFQMFEGGLKGFIFKGTNGRWRDVLTADELAAYDARVEQTLSPQCAAWMEQGRSAL